MKTVPPGWPPAAGPEPEVLIKEARHRQRRRYLLAGLATIAVLAAVAGVTAALAGPAGHPPAHKSPRRVVHRAAGTPAVPARAMRRLTGTVAYTCGTSSICLMRPDGSGKRTLPATDPVATSPIWPPAAEWDPAWSPDGRRLAFRGYYAPYAEGDYALYVVDANGCHLTRLTHHVNGITPAWSPTGRQIAFAGGGIDVINANGTGLRRLTSDIARSGRTWYGDDEPSWSARNRIAFARGRMGTSRGEIYVMNPDGSGVTPLTHGAPGFDQPSWSPNGKAIAFVADTVPRQSAGVIEVANANGTGRHRVSPPTWASYSPTWTPGGKIVFLVIKGFQYSQLGSQVRASAYIVNRDGTGLRLLYPHLGDAGQITWGPTPLPRAGC